MAFHMVFNHVVTTRHALDRKEYSKNVHFIRIVEVHCEEKQQWRVPCGLPATVALQHSQLCFQKRKETCNGAYSTCKYLIIGVVVTQEESSRVVNTTKNKIEPQHTNNRVTLNSVLNCLVCDIYFYINGIWQRTFGAGMNVCVNVRQAKAI